MKHLGTILTVFFIAVMVSGIYTQVSSKEDVNAGKNLKEITDIKDVKSEKSCTVYVKWYSRTGKPAKNIKVVGYTDKHNLSTEGTQIAYTDSNGKVTLRWDSYRDLYILYIDGTGHKGTYTDGGTYTFAID